jgi:hypothetical protein
MKLAALFLVIFTGLTGQAFADAYVFQTQPNCYKGKIELTSLTRNNATRVLPVQLTLDRVSDSYTQPVKKIVFVSDFRIDKMSFENSGTIVNSSTLAFNYNDDYIPGGNASYNIDIQLIFTAQGATGTYNEYAYDDGDGRGGYGESLKDAKAKQLQTGTFTLENCQNYK